MSLEFHWLDRPLTMSDLGQVVRRAQRVRFDEALISAGVGAWLKFLVSLQPELTSPTVPAQVAATFQDLSGGRLVLNMTEGRDDATRLARIDEFLTVVRRLWAGEEVTLRGEHLSVEGASLAQTPHAAPPIYLGGYSKEAGAVAAKHADVYLARGEEPESVVARVRWIRGLAALRGRKVRVGLRVHTINCDPRGEAWAGIGLVGSPTEVADRFEEYHDAGISEFVLSGYPHVEAARRFAEGMLPVLEERGLWTRPGAEIGFPADMPELGSAVAAAG